jgi:catechol 2,3-dioxygenase-like lactoylglutathione lyase family enzyme
MTEAHEEFWMRPVLAVRDVEASVAYYADQLGFARAWAHGDDGWTIAAVERQGLQLILDGGTDLPRLGSPSVLSLTLHAHEGLAALHREFAARGANLRSKPFPVTWQQGTWQFEVEDLDGNVLIFWGDGLAS